MHMGNIIRENVIIVKRHYHAAREYCRRLMLFRYLTFVADAIIYLVCIFSRKQRKIANIECNRGRAGCTLHAGCRALGRAAARSHDVNRDSSFLLPAQSDNGGKMFSTCGDAARGVGSIAGALISVGIVRINGSYCRVCCLFSQ